MLDDLGDGLFLNWGVTHVALGESAQIDSELLNVGFIQVEAFLIFFNDVFGVCFFTRKRIAWHESNQNESDE